MTKRSVPICQARLKIPAGLHAPHVLIMGKTGAGKTQYFGLPLYDASVRAGDTVAVINTKGQPQSRVLEHIAAQNGVKVSKLVLTDPTRSIGWNVLGQDLEPSEAREVGDDLAMASELRPENINESAFWLLNAMEWTSEACAALAKLPVASRDRSLLGLRQVIASGAYEAFANRFPMFPTLAKFAKFEKSGAHNAGTISADLSMRTKFLSIPEVAAVISHDELSLTQFVRTGGVLIVEVNERDLERLRPLLNLFIKRLLSVAKREADRSPGARLDPRLRVFVPDFASVGRIPGAETFLHTCRESGISVIADCQSISQFVSVYGKHAETVLDAFPTHMVVAGVGPVTAQYYSGRSGTTTVKSYTAREQGGMAYAVGDDENPIVEKSWTSMARPVLLPSEIVRPADVHPVFGRMPVTMFLSGVRPFHAYVTPAYEQGRLARAIEKAATMPADADKREQPLEVVEPTMTIDAADSNPANTSGISNTTGWTDEQIHERLTETLAKLDESSLTGSARKWWDAFMKENQHRPALVLRLAEELAMFDPPCTLTEFFLAYVYANCDNIQAVVDYARYRRRKKEWDALQRQKNTFETGATVPADGNYRPVLHEDPERLGFVHRLRRGQKFPKVRGKPARWMIA